MIHIDSLTLETAKQLLDFGRCSEAAKAYATIQLDGAVAIHNLLARGRVAYLGDDVGLGKTYTAQGTIALLRHFHPDLRVLYVVPKANLQRKWLKEIWNFTANNWLIEDHRVKTFQGTPVVEPVLCENLLHLVREAAIDAHRDFILRLSSFSLPLSRRDGGEDWRRKANELLRVFPGLGDAALEVDGRSSDAQEQRKDKFAAAVNALLPHFDLLVLDEGHNLKRGFQDDQGAARNRLLAYVLGTKKCRNAGPLVCRIDRAVILSATPVDASFLDLWNQLDLLGLADERFKALRELEPDKEGETKRAASQFLIRRLTEIKIDGKPHTRNMYRREWRGGGVDKHDEPLKVPDQCQRLIVALMQKTVADLLAEQGRERPDRFSRRFQIGMLASFESFSQTAKARSEDANFDQPEQSRDPYERQGIDTSTVNHIATSYRTKFGSSPPHPKMDAVVDELWRSFLQGRKTLVFVRRIHSVPEMVEKLTEKYNKWLRDRICEDLNGLPDSERQRFNRTFDQYVEERKDFYSRRAVAAFAGTQVLAHDSNEPTSRRAEDAEPSGFESFFSWFFRGKGPKGIVSGGSLSANRLKSDSALLSTLFEDNWLLWLLNYPAEPLDEMAKRVGKDRDELADELRRCAAAIHGTKKAARRHVFLAYQQAALEFLSKQTADTALSEGARTILAALEISDSRTDVTDDRRSFPEPRAYLGVKTFFTELAQREALCKRLWPGPIIGSNRDRAAITEREQRRLFLSSAIRLGHPMVDLWVLYAKLAGTLAPGKLDDGEPSDEQPPSTGISPAERLAAELVNLLDSQRNSTEPPAGLTSFMELHRLANDFRLLLDVNFHEMRGLPWSDMREYIGNQLGQQQPIAGMYGGVQRRTVTQFRMPGYPYVLVTTDVLQEGEDLHTYCDRIMHYGISWTPSAMEQRTGRVDRIGSLVQRRLEQLKSYSEDDYLQVYFPYLNDTYEYVQVGVVFARLNRFLEMLHDLRMANKDHGSEVDVARQIHEKAADVFNAYRKRLKSGFEIAEDLLKREEPAKPVVHSANDHYLKHFHDLTEGLAGRFLVEWSGGDRSDHACKGTAFVRDGRLLAAHEKDGHNGARQQRFSLTLRTTHGGSLLLRCTSGLGSVRGEEQVAEVLRLQRKYPHLKVCAVSDDTQGSYRLSVQSDLLFSAETTQAEELEHAFSTMLADANQLKNEILGGEDHSEAEFTGEDSEGNHHEVD